MVQYSFFLAAMAATVLAQDACVDKCNSAYSDCRTAPEANQATCASEYAECLGYLPYAANGTLITPTACSSQAVATSSAVTPISQIGDGQVQVPTAAPSQASPPAEASPTGSSCLDKCNAAYRACQFAPDANFSFCASEYAACLGYGPYDSMGNFVTPTACSSQAGSTAPAQSTGGGSTAPSVVYTTEVVTALTTYCPAPTTMIVNDKTYTVTAATTMTISDCPCTITSAVPAPTPTEAAPPNEAPAPSNEAPATSVPLPITSVSAASPTGAAPTSAVTPISQISDGQIQVPAPTGPAQAPSAPAESAPAPPADTPAAPVESAPAAPPADAPNAPEDDAPPAAALSTVAVVPTPIQVGEGAASGTGAIPAYTGPAFQGAGAITKPAMAMIALGAFAFL